MENFKLAKESFEDYLERVAERKRGTYKCPICGRSDFEFRPSSLLLINLGEKINDKVVAVDPKDSLIVRAVICKKCKNVQLFSVN